MDQAGLVTATAMALFLVPIVSFIKKPSWSTRAKYLLGMGTALFCAVVGALVDGEVNSTAEAVAYFGTALAASQTLYTLYFADTGLEATLRAK
jgi:hypothetical protein